MRRKRKKIKRILKEEWKQLKLEYKNHRIMFLTMIAVIFISLIISMSNYMPLVYSENYNNKLISIDKTHKNVNFKKEGRKILKKMKIKLTPKMKKKIKKYLKNI